MGMKQCSICRQLRDIDKFGYDSGNPDGRHRECRDCRKIKDKQIRNKHNPNNIDPRDWIGKEEPFPNTSLIIKSAVRGTPMVSGRNGKSYYNQNVLVDCLCGIKDISLRTTNIKKGHTVCCSSTCQYSVRNQQAKLAGEQFIQKAKLVHGEKYDYSKVAYKNKETKITIGCPKHGEYQQNPSSHLAGRGCTRCTNSISRGETDWLDSLGIPKEQRNIWIYIEGYGKIKPDGYDPLTNTIYEYHGDYFHGNLKIYEPDEINRNNKKTMAQLFQDTVKRSAAIRDAGYNLVSIWESDWKKQGKGNH